jgi:hypothetical protein
MMCACVSGVRGDSTSFSIVAFAPADAMTEGMLAVPLSAHGAEVRKAGETREKASSRGLCEPCTLIRHQEGVRHAPRNPVRSESHSIAPPPRSTPPCDTRDRRMDAVVPCTGIRRNGGIARMASTKRSRGSRSCQPTKAGRIMHLETSPPGCHDRALPRPA